jgi:adenine-specific DNA-methyltransferase
MKKHTIPKLAMQTPNLVSQNIDTIATLFPWVMTEIENESGEIVKAIDFDLLKQHLSDSLVEGPDERYRLDWPGKRASILKANTPINKTLRPIREESVNFDTTENLYIEGDNFEVLKVLQESYLGKVKMIYIDPPYNTGKDFVYKDNFRVSQDEYEEGLDIVDEEGGKLVRNTDTNGRFHSDWLSMMYERLLVARDLLKEDGVIFMSIDDNEVHNLRKIADEVFGEENFVAELVWENKEWGGSSDSNFFRIKHEYILCYSKNYTQAFIRWEESIEDESYTFEDEYLAERWRYKLIKLNSFSIQYSKSLDYEIQLPNWEIALPSENGLKKWCWRWSKQKFEWWLKNNFVEFRKNQDGNLWVYTKQYFKVDNNGQEVIRQIPHRGVISKFSSTQATKQVEKLFWIKMFDYSKPYDLICFLSKITTSKDDLILDFFSGSATTAHAVIQLNTEDGGNRKYIMVQIPEKTDTSSEAYKAGYKNICEIGKERIRRAGKKILEENRDKPGIEKLDIGFRVLKLDSTNMKDVYYHPTQITQDSLFEMESNIKEDRSSEDLLLQVMLDLGLTLDLPIESKTIAWNTVYFVAGNSLIACFDENIAFEMIDEIAKYTPLKVVFCDASFQTDADRMNFETRFKKLSPETDVRVI